MVNRYTHMQAKGLHDKNKYKNLKRERERYSLSDGGAHLGSQLWGDRGRAISVSSRTARTTE